MKRFGKKNEGQIRNCVQPAETVLPIVQPRRKLNALKQSRPSTRSRGILLASPAKALQHRVSPSCTHHCFSAHLPDCTGVSTGVTLVNSWSKLLVSVALEMVGMNGAGIRLWYTSSQLMFLKKAWLMISCASVGPLPRRSSGSLVRSFCRIETESRGMWIGYSGSSARMAS